MSNLGRFVEALDDHAARTPEQRGERIEWTCPACGNKSWSYATYLIHGATPETATRWFADHHECRVDPREV